MRLTPNFCSYLICPSTTGEALVNKRNTAPLPDSGQWTVLFSNEKLPKVIVALLREPIIGLHHYLMLFLLLAFSVLYGCVKAPGMALGARYMFTMACGRLIRVSTFTATILPSARPWCAQARFTIANHPHPWAQKYYVPYSKDPRMVQQIISRDEAFASLENYPAEYVPNWGSLQFLVNILRPRDPAKTGQTGYDWFNTFKNSAAGGCNDLMFSGHVFVAVLTAMAWQEAYPGWTSTLIWLLVVHTAQREIRERHHYSVDVVTGVYFGIFLWNTTGWIWASRDQQKELKLKLLAAVEDDIQKAAKDGNLEKITYMLNKVSTANKDNEQKDKVSYWFTMLLGCFVLFMTLGLGLLTFTWTANG
ncbi:protein PHLOEM UNLOADING MODULATOR isoform X2 [Physcomitrium patens]|uniref:protein PHLOEM UNLOADING MODULATOR isoform X2 n=1 Tax=Physcomitrium patens TaxID=3218 RepID=UPI003CCD9CCA